MPEINQQLRSINQPDIIEAINKSSRGGITTFQDLEEKKEGIRWSKDVASPLLPYSRRNTPITKGQGRSGRKIVLITGFSPTL